MSFGLNVLSGERLIAETTPRKQAVKMGKHGLITTKLIDGEVLHCFEDAFGPGALVLNPFTAPACKIQTSGAV